MVQRFKKQIGQWRGILIAAPSITCVVIATGSLGLFQILDWAALDLFFRWRPREPIEPRIVIITIDESDIAKVGQWPISDALLAKLLEKIKIQKPRAIGLDLFRNLPVQPGHQTLVKVFNSTPNLIGVEKIVGHTVPPPPELSQLNQIGLADLVLDADGKVRRGLLSVKTDGKTHLTLGTKLALMYLEKEGITLQSINDRKKHLRLGKAVFVPFGGNEGGYVRANSGGYQILLNYRGTQENFQTVSLTEVLSNRVSPNIFTDRAVLVGSIGPSFNDLSFTPYSSNFFATPKRLPGVVIHANLTSQILSAALDGRPFIHVMTEPIEGLWILFWASIGSAIGSTLQVATSSNKKILYGWIFSGFNICVIWCILIGGSYLAFWGNWWLPVVSPLLAMTGSAIALVGYRSLELQYLANLKRKQAEIALRKSEANFRRLAENVPGVIYRYVLYLDGTDEFTYLSPGIVELWGREPEAAMQNPQLIWEALHLNDLHSLKESIKISAQTLQPWRWEGQIETLERIKWIQCISRPEKQPNGDIVWDGLIVDITSRKIAEQLLADYNRTLETQVQERTVKLAQANGQLKQEIASRQQIEARYRAILEDQTELIVRFLSDGTVIFVNEAFCRFFGLKREELIGHHYEPVVFEDDREHVAKGLNSISAKNPVVTIENRVMAGGRVYWTQWSDRGIFDEFGSIVEFQAVGRDISDRKQAEVQLEGAKEAAEAANRAKSAFLANMSHELRTPLNAILGFSQLISSATNLSKEQQENLNIIHRSGEHLLTLINQVLDLSKIEAGRMTLNENGFDLYRLLDDIKAMFSLKAKEKGLTLRFNRDANVPQHIHTDEVKLRQVLINLLSNALKFTASGSVSVTVSAISSQIQHKLIKFPLLKEGAKISDSTNSGNSLTVHFEVSDTGVGIASDEIDNLFQPFQQTTSGKQVQEGTGLGLAIGRQFIRLMGGEITVISRGKIFNSSMGLSEFNDDRMPTVGTTFKFNIQAKIANTKAIEDRTQSREAIALVPSQVKYRILVVDDSDDNRRLLEKTLHPLGFELQVANNGYQALKIWESWLPHLILMDMRMPVMDGYEATQKIREWEYALRPEKMGNRTVIIALTASALVNEKAASMAAGCDDLIPKPFQQKDIFDAIQKHLGGSLIYEELTPVDNSRTKDAIALTTADFIGLHEDWLASLRQALTEGDLERINILIEQLSLENELLGNAILALTNQYQFEQLLALIQQGVN